jgi:TolB-like protein
MKKLIFSFVIIFLAGIVFGQTIVVSTFSTRGQAVTADDAESITELFIAELAKQSGVRVVDRTSLDRVLTEMRFQASDWSDSQKTARLGAALNAEFLVRGQLNQLGPQISFALTALDIRTLEVVSSSTRTFSADTIFTNGRDGLFYNMDTLASGIASPIKTKMTQLAKQKQEQEQQSALVGTWFARGSNFSHRETGISNAERNMTITFNRDGTLYITVNWAGWQNRGGSVVGQLVVSGSGHYTWNDDQLRISWDRHDSGRVYRSREETSGQGRNAMTNTVWGQAENFSRRLQHTFTVTMEFSQAGKNMTWLTWGNGRIDPDDLPIMGWYPAIDEWGSATIRTGISNLFVKQ